MAYIICKLCKRKKDFLSHFSYLAKKHIYCSKRCASKAKKGIPHRKKGNYPKWWKEAMSKGWENKSPKFKHIIKEWLQENYIEKKLGAVECARLKNCSYVTIYRKLNKFNIPIRNGSECQVGELGHNWQGGKSYEIYPIGWNKTFKEQVRYRDGYKCQMCGVPEMECRRKLHTHHIDYNKQNINLNNLISLCISCHIKTNYNRNYWIKYLGIFTELWCK